MTIDPLAEARDKGTKAAHVEHHWLTGHGGRCEAEDSGGRFSCHFAQFDCERIANAAIDAFLANLPEGVYVGKDGPVKAAPMWVDGFQRLFVLVPLSDSSKAEEG